MSSTPGDKDTSVPLAKLIIRDLALECSRKDHEARIEALKEVSERFRYRFAEIYADCERTAGGHEMVVADAPTIFGMIPHRCRWCGWVENR